MVNAMSTQLGVTKDRRSKVANACRRCRKHKIKCSGSIPCKTCSDKGEICQSNAGDRRVAVSASVLRDLQDKVTEYERQQQQLLPRLNRRASPESAQEQDRGDSSENWLLNQPENQNAGAVSQNGLQAQGLDNAGSPQACMSNPLVPDKPRYMRDAEGQLRYLGHSSTFSFSRQVLSMLRQHPNFGQQQETPVSWDAETYLESYITPLSQTDLAGLPSLEVSLLNVQLVKFRTNPLYYLFEETTFVRSLHQFYEDLAMGLQPSRIWYVHYLLIMALGKALNPQKGSTTVPGIVPGIELFNRALRILPDMTALYREPLLSTEVLCCIALYLFSIDHRSSGYIYMGKALRLAQVEGIHTDLQENCVGPSFLARGRRIWWTVYTLDRRLSSSMGVPDSIRDEDVTAPDPTGPDQAFGSMAQALHVKICRLLRRMVHTVYSPDGRLDKNFVLTAQEVLRGIGEMAYDLVNFSSRCVGDISVVVAQLNLAFHQCIILCTRPFLFHLLKLRLESTNPTHPLPLLTPTKGLVQAGVDSAVQIAMIISQLQQHDLLDTFLPFDLESTFSAGLVLAIVKGIHPKLLPTENWMSSILAALDYLAMNGNRQARARKSEIEELTAIRWNSPHIRHVVSNNDPTSTAMPQTSPASTDLPSLGDPFFDYWGTDDGLSGAQLISLADALDFPEAADLITL